MDRGELEARVEELREENPGRDEFIRAVKEFSETLDPASRAVLAQVLLSREPSTGGFDEIERRREEGGWIRRTMRKAETYGRRPPR
jgi:hypothetical protein